MEHHPPNDADRVELDDPIARILKFAGSRPQPDQERQAEFKRALRAEWRRVTEPRSQRRTFGWAAGVAAGVAAALVLAWLQPWKITQQPSVTQVVGRVVRSEGSVRRLPATSTSSPSQSVTVGDEIPADTVLETAETGRMALALGEGLSLRIDVGSRILLVADRVVTVERGAVYVDSSAEKSGPVLIHTQNGDVRDIGTQFEVRAGRSSFRVRVREGEVLVKRNDSEMTARAGEGLHVDQQGRYSSQHGPNLRARVGMDQHHRPAIPARGQHRSAIPRVGGSRAGVALAVRRCRHGTSSRRDRDAWFTRRIHT